MMQIQSSQTNQLSDNIFISALQEKTIQTAILKLETQKKALIHKNLIFTNQKRKFIAIFPTNLYVRCLRLYNNLDKIMTQKKIRKQKWSVEESEYLKLLKEQQNISSWKQISKQIQLKFPQNSKSAKQCRQKYINYSKFNEQPLKSGWTEEQDRILANLYLQNGSCWSTFSSHLNNRAENCIKNRFYNRLKRFSKKIDEHRLSHKEQLRGISSFESMIRILDFSNQVKTLSFQNNLSVNTDSILYKTRIQILSFCFENTDFLNLTCEQLCNLVKNMKLINIKIRCFGICKAKNRKNWKLSKKVLDSSLQFNLHITSEPNIEMNESQQKEDMEEENQVQGQEQSILEEENKLQLQKKKENHLNVKEQYNFVSPFLPFMYFQSFSIVMRPEQMNMGLNPYLAHQEKWSCQKTKIEEQNSQILLKKIGQENKKIKFEGKTRTNIIIKSRMDNSMIKQEGPYLQTEGLAQREGDKNESY